MKITVVKVSVPVTVTPVSNSGRCMPKDMLRAN